MPWKKQSSSGSAPAPAAQGFNRQVLFSLAVEQALWSSTNDEVDMLVDAAPFIANPALPYPGSRLGIPPAVRAEMLIDPSYLVSSHLMCGIRFDTPNQSVFVREYWGATLMREIALNSSHFPVDSLGYAIPLQLFGAYNSTSVDATGMYVRTHSWTVGAAPGNPGYVTAAEGWDAVNSNYPRLPLSGVLPVRVTAQWAQTSEESILHVDHFELIV